jgi:recombination protein RecA
MDDKDEVGYLVKVKVAKNKIAPPFKKCEIPVLRGVGYDRNLDIIEAAVVLKIITKAGAFYTLGENKYQGKARLSTALNEDISVRDKLDKQIRKAIKKMRMGEKVIEDGALDKLEGTTLESKIVTGEEKK